MGKLFSAVVHYAKPNLAEVVHAHVRFLVVIFEDSLVLVGEKPVEAQGLVQGGMRFLEVTHGKQIVSQVQAVCSEKTMPFTIRQAGAVTPGQMRFGLFPVVAHEVFPCIAQISIQGCS